MGRRSRYGQASGTSVAALPTWGGICVLSVLTVPIAPACSSSSSDDIPTPSLAFELVRQIGDMEGSAAFGTISAIAAHPNGLLAVGEWTSCRITLIDRASGAVLRRIGRCGQGPGEFTRIQILALSQDSILVVEPMAMHVQVLDFFGHEGRRLQLRSLSKVGATMLTHLTVVNDTTWLVGLGLTLRGKAAAADPDNADNLLAYVDSRTGTPYMTFHRDDEFSIRNRNGVVRSAISCASPHAAHDVAAFSVWTFAGATYGGGSTTPTSAFAVPIDWAAPRLVGPQEWIWPSGYYYADCGERWVAFRYIAVEDTSQRGERGHIEVRSYGGDVLVSRDMTRADSALFGLGAALGDRLYVASNSIYEYPLISEFRLRTAESTGQ